MRVRAPRLMISAAASGQGKTTVMCGLLRLLSRQGLRAQACKCGPDYLDPLFHTQVLGTPSRNLDLFFAGETLVRQLVAEGAQDADLTLMEGAMGYYDGIAQSDQASAYEVARVTETPVVLVVDARGRALSVAAEVAGFVRFRTPSQVAGVILNRVSASYYPLLMEVVERECGVDVLGYVPTLPEAALESRHLGLVAPSEVADLQHKLDLVADTLAQTLDLGALQALAERAPSLCVEPHVLPALHPARPVVAVARDEAFNFYYHDTIELLEALGAQIAWFSPLAGDPLPEGTAGLYLGGGYPELHAAELSTHAALRAQIAQAVAGGLPTIAECGGFLYLHEYLQDKEGSWWPMVGAVPGRAYPQGRLGRFGYVTLTARGDSLIAKAGERMPAHEFHYWESSRPGDAFDARKPQSTRAWEAGVVTPTLYAGFPHLYLPACPAAADRFVAACATYAARTGEVPS